MLRSTTQSAPSKPQSPVELRFPATRQQHTAASSLGVQPSAGFGVFRNPRRAKGGARLATPLGSELC